MADGTVKFDPKTHVEATKKAWLKKQEIYRNMYYGKSKYPPMSIEPFAEERQRLPFQMTAEDRALRHQWLQDQFLTKNEPRYVPELRPRNFFRRMFGMPWDVATKAITPAVGLDKARIFRYLGPKLGMYFAGLFIVADYFTHNKSHWEMARGWNMFTSKLAVYPDEPLPENGRRDYHEKHRGDFFNRGFAQRKVLLD